LPAVAGAVARSASVAAVDNLPPSPPTQVRAIDVPADQGGAIEISWALSADDGPRFRGLGGTTAVGAGGPVAVYRDNGVDGYRVYRWLEDAGPQLIAEVAPGVAYHIDATVFNKVTYVYEVRVVDGPHEVGELILPGSSQDRARAAFALNNGGPPSAIPGWFDPSDDRIDFNDFFLFADHFGTIDGQAEYDPLYDLSPNSRIDFDDFFVFADNWRRRLGDNDLPGQ
jgi:hypothetical protein|tara:strand:+ start:386 stop:1063 length:678 start_codon:yes stop_codon:yes gene_type:complete